MAFGRVLFETITPGSGQSATAWKSEEGLEGEVLGELGMLGTRGEVVIVQVNVSVPWGWLRSGRDAAGIGGNDGANNAIAHHSTDSNGSDGGKKLDGCDFGRNGIGMVYTKV